MEFLRHLFDPGVPEPVEPASLRRMAAGLLALNVIIALGNVATRIIIEPGGRASAYDAFLLWNLPGVLVAVPVLSSFLLSRATTGMPAWRVRIVVVALAWGMVPGSWLVGGFAMMLNLVFAMILVAGARMLLGWKVGLWALAALFTCDAFFALLQVSGALPPLRALPDAYVPEALGGAAVFVMWRMAFVAATFWLASYAANRYRASEHQLRILNAELESRVTRQVAELERATRLRRYLAPQLVDELLAADVDPGASRDRRPITVLFADLRGFTGMVERLAPEVLAQALQLYFTELTHVAFRHGGTIDKFIGDAIMILFGAPRATGEGDQARRCVEMAREIQVAVAGLAGRLAELDVAPLQVRIGIGSGMATVGTFGAENRADYTAVGAPVNRAARLEPLAPPGGILVDARTQELLGGAIPIEVFGEVTLKGFGSPQQAFRVID